MKVLVILAGPNGAGKSTLMSEIRRSPFFPTAYICPDEFAKLPEFSDIPNVKERYAKAMEHAEMLRYHAIRLGMDLAVETVFSTEEKMEYIKYAKNMGYFVELIYITTANPRINIRRVKQRVKTGGHDVEKEKIISRYKKSMSFLPKAVLLADTAKVYDNSRSKPVLVFFKRLTGEMVLLNKEYRPKWVKPFISALSEAGGFPLESIKNLNAKNSGPLIREAYADRIGTVRSLGRAKAE